MPHRNPNRSGPQLRPQGHRKPADATHVGCPRAHSHSVSPEGAYRGTSVRSAPCRNLFSLSRLRVMEGAVHRRHHAPLP